jgi:hypothetical protein
VTDYLFTPILERMRLASAGPEAIDRSELEKFDAWVKRNYKFMNYAKRSLIGGEKVMHAILQSEIRANEITVFGKTYYRVIAPALACILTDRELIMIREVDRKRGEGRYGGIWDYIPLNKIAGLSLSEKDSRLLGLSIRLPESVYLDFLFQTPAREEVDQLLERFRELSI